MAFRLSSSPLSGLERQQRSMVLLSPSCPRCGSNQKHRCAMSLLTSCTLPSHVALAFAAGQMRSSIQYVSQLTCVSLGPCCENVLLSLFFLCQAKNTRLQWIISQIWHETILASTATTSHYYCWHRTSLLASGLIPLYCVIVVPDCCMLAQHVMPCAECERQK